MGNVTENLFCL